MLQTWLSGLSTLSLMIGLNSARSSFKARLQRPHETASISMHTNIQWCSTRSQARPDRRKGQIDEGTHGNAPTREQKQQAPNQRTPLLLLLLAHALPCTKSKVLPIDAPPCIYYF
jgi:hypothetical protein